MIPTNPALVLKYRRGRERVRETLTAEEATRLLKAVGNERDEAIIDLLLGTGLRLESLVALDVGDVRIKKGQLVLRSMKGGNKTLKAIPTTLKRKLGRYLRHRGEADKDCPALFLSNRGLRLCARQIQQMIEKCGHEAGILKRVTPYVLRRTYATWLYAKTKDLLLVQRALDHRLVGTTIRYAGSGAI